MVDRFLRIYELSETNKGTLLDWQSLCSKKQFIARRVGMTLKSNFTKRTAIILALTLGQSLAMSPTAVFAADGSIRIAGNTVFENKVASGGMSVEQRAESIQKNLDNALVAAKDRTVGIVYVKGVPAI